MHSLANSPWRGAELKAPVVLAIAVLAIAAWKASCSRGYQGDDGHPASPEDVDGGSPPGRDTNTGSRRGDKDARGRMATRNGSGNSTRVRSSSKTSDNRLDRVGNGCRCSCHDGDGHGKREVTNTRSGGGGDITGDVGSAGKSEKNSERRVENGAIGQVATATTTTSKCTSDNEGTSPPPNTNKHRCECGAAAGSSITQRRRGSEIKTNGSGSHHHRRRQGTGRHGGYGRSRGRDRLGTGGGLGRAAAATAAAAARSAGLKADGKGAGGADEEKATEEGATVEEALTVRRMCRLPGVVLRSGLVYQRVISLALPGQGLGDEDIPANVARLAGMLRKVDLSRNKFTEVPPGLLRLGGGLEDLNLGNNQIEELPAEIAELTGLLSLNMAGNRLSTLPSEVGRLPALKRLGLKGNALVQLPSSIGDLSHLVELYLTSNKLEELPGEIVKLRRLRKLQLSFNQLRSLPPGMEGMRSLELCRLAVNPGLAIVPEGLAFAERLSWISLAGSAWCARAMAKRRRNTFPQIERDDVELLEKLGSGASGDVFAAIYQGRDVAVKVFKSEFGPDGSVRDELDVAFVVDHPNVTNALGVVHGAEQWLVMERVPGKPLAEKPDFSSVLRCRWGAGRRFEPVLVLAVLLQVARAMSYLHERGICHGDLYAHNVLVDAETGAAVLCDFGASFFYHSEKHEQNSFALEGTEVRAFGLLARDMARRSAGCEWILQDLVPTCLQPDAGHRPSFHEIVNQLHAELMQSVEPSSPMVTSAKSVHSLLDRPDIAAERERQRSQERRKEISSTSSGFGIVRASKREKIATATAPNNTGYKKSHAQKISATPNVLSGSAMATEAGARSGVGGGKRCVPAAAMILGGVVEGTADDEGVGQKDSPGGCSVEAEGVVEE